MGLEKCQIPVISPWLPSRDFTNFWIPPSPNIWSQNNVEIFPYPRTKNPIHLLVFPRISPWGSTPRASRWHVHNIPRVTCTFLIYTVTFDKWGIPWYITKKFNIILLYHVTEFSPTQSMWCTMGSLEYRRKYNSFPVFLLAVFCVAWYKQTSCEHCQNSFLIFQTN